MTKSVEIAFCLFLMAGCAGSTGREEGVASKSDRVLNQLTLFVEAIHEEDFERALSFVDPAEAARMKGADGRVTGDHKVRLKALRLSTLAHKSGVRLGRNDKLVGIYDQLPEALMPDPSRRADLPDDGKAPPSKGRGKDGKGGFPVPEIEPSSGE